MSRPVRRQIAAQLCELRDKYPVITVTGPRQAGKTTLCRMEFPELPYANLEAPDTREFATADPRGFLAGMPHGGVIDEFQRVPELTSYIQVLVDEPGFKGVFVLTGSQNLQISDRVSQSLAGRTALVSLLPFALTELPAHGQPLPVDELIYRGFLPRIHDRELNPSQALADYVGTYVERDLRQLSMVKDLSLFQAFLRLCAGRTGQLLSLQGLGNDAGVSQPTAREWLSLLEASYILFRLPPFFANISKRLVKSPKLYFYDVGLAAFLMGITDPSQIPAHPLRGMLFENLVVVEVMKHFLNRGTVPNVHFYRDSNGNEVDLVIQRAHELIPLEIKAAQTVATDFFKGLKRLSAAVPHVVEPTLVYGGTEARLQSGVNVCNLHSLDPLLTRLFT